MNTYVCSQYDQTRIEVPSLSRQKTHIITFDRYRQQLVCSCEGFHNRGTCRHIKNIDWLDIPCNWIGDDPDFTDGEYYCPECGAKVYELPIINTVDSRQILDTSDTHIFKDNDEYNDANTGIELLTELYETQRGNIIIRKGNDRFWVSRLNPKKKEKVCDILFGNSDLIIEQDMVKFDEDDSVEVMSLLAYTL